MKESKAIITIYILYYLVPILNACILLGKNLPRVYYPMIDKFYSGSWLIYFEMKYLIVAVFIVCMPLATYVKEGRKHLIVLAVFCLIVQAINMIVFRLYHFERDSGLVLIIGCVYLVPITYQAVQWVQGR